jgi:N-acetylmuramoyl-L-alanine amidase
MPDDNRFRDDEDREFQEWLKNRPPSEEEIPASVAFMEMMRQAAARRQPASQAAADDRTPDSAPPETVVEEQEYSAAEDEAVPEAPRRQRRRKERRVQRTVGILGGIIRSFIIIITAAGLTATIFTWWTPSKFITSDVRDELSVALATSIATLEPTALPTPNWARRVGIVSGHRGPQNDPGAVCPDGLTEASINEAVSAIVVRNLRGRGYTVDLLDEFDPRLDNYQAAALLSIHANTCQSFGEVVSGYLIAAAAARITSRGTDGLLVDCVSQHYASATGLERREGVTVDMTDYHTFREIHPHTPAAIIELGFMLADRQILTEGVDTLGRGITDGMICFLEPSASQGT